MCSLMVSHVYVESVTPGNPLNLRVKIVQTVDEMRDRRLRHFYGERYDHRANLCDWDYQNAVRPVASIIHPKLFK